MPMSLAKVANLYVSVTSSLVGVKTSTGVFDLVFILLLFPSVLAWL